MKSIIGMTAFTAVLGAWASNQECIAQTWMQTSAPVTNLEWVSIGASADAGQLAAAARTSSYPYGGPIVISTDSGKSWISNAVAAAWSAIACSADGMKLIALDSSIRVFTSTNSGASWSYSAVPAPFSCLASSADGTKLALGAWNGSIYLSTNSGS